MYNETLTLIHFVLTVLQATLMVILLVVCFAHGNIVCSFLKSNHMVNTKCSSTKGRPKENSGGGQRNYSITGIHFTNEDYHVDKVQSVIFDLLALKPP